jgi:hypothetical protein
MYIYNEQYIAIQLGMENTNYIGQISFHIHLNHFGSYFLSLLPITLIG